MRVPSCKPSPALALRNIVRSHGKITILNGICLVREEPGVIALLGKNGAGKTTLLRICAQLTLADAGTIHVCGKRVDHADNALVRKLTGWAPHEPLAWREDSVRQNLLYAAELGGVNKQEARQVVASSIERWGLTSVSSTRVHQLSRGWSQRYSLARADLFTPPLLLLDEPTTGLDLEARQLLTDTIKEWRKDRIVLVSSHERDWISGLADQILDLDLNNPLKAET